MHLYISISILLQIGLSFPPCFYLLSCKRWATLRLMHAWGASCIARQPGALVLEPKFCQVPGFISTRLWECQILARVGFVMSVDFALWICAWDLRMWHVLTCCVNVQFAVQTCVTWTCRNCFLLWPTIAGRHQSIICWAARWRVPAALLWATSNIYLQGRPLTKKSWELNSSRAVYQWVTLGHGHLANKCNISDIHFCPVESCHSSNVIAPWLFIVIMS